MKYFSLLLFAGALIAGNFFYQWITYKDWELAFDRSYFQFVALNLYWFFKV